ncbi:PspC domain-containing protein [Marinilactibacillus piezotolerans]|uniref:PspC domain-containing protein n=1 Tax=Marinilactibacillus piezotolerans TaxID=258723 RepID=UPI0009B05D60|nr:PspC domain-containing protein [Marinilactibacillus piezotolerans]
MRGRLTKSSYDRYISGVCGGIAEFLGLPSWAVRLLFVLFVPSIMLYIILAIVMPED